MTGDRRRSQRADAPAGDGHPWSGHMLGGERDPVGELDSALRDIDALAVVFDRRGRIVAHSQRWIEVATTHGVEPHLVGIGADYHAACEATMGGDVEAARRAASGIRSVLDGDERQFTMDYEYRGPDSRRWFALRVAHLVGPGSGALVTHTDITAVRSVEQSVRGQIHRLWDVVVPDADFVLLLDENGIVVGRTSNVSRSDQWPAVGQPALNALHPIDRDRIVALFEACRATPGARTETSFRARPSPQSREWRHFSLEAVNMLDDHKVHGIVVAVTDLTDRLREAAARSLSLGLTEHLPLVAVATDDVGIVTAVNAAAIELIAVPEESLLGRPLGNFVAEVEETDLGEAMAAKRTWTGDIDLRRADGTVVPVWGRVEHIVDPVTGFPGRRYLALDHSEERRLRESLLHRERHDTLTGLPNRAAFLRHITGLAGELGPHEVGLVALVSIDGFRELNAVHGSAVGDGALRAVGVALRGRAGPEGMVARLYGDVFAVAVGPGRASPSFPDELRAAIETVDAGEGVSLRLTASIGVRRVRPGEPDTHAVVDEALSAATEVKRTGGDGARHHDEALIVAMRHRTTLRRDLPAAITAGQLAVEYQPVVRLDDGTVVGAEALVRWDHPVLGRIAPDDFIPLAEHSAAINDIGSFVLDDACRHAARWRDLRPETPLNVAVNVSPAQLSDPGLPERVRETIGRHHLDPSSITLELTESMIMDDSEVGRRQIHGLKATGVRIAVDDFGTGYSSLARLKYLPLDVIKIDRSFVRDVGSNPEDASIIQTVVSLANAFGVDVVAEGVETMDDGRALREVGCFIGQGFLWSPAVPPELLDDMIRQPFPCAPTPQTGAETVDRFEAFSDALRTIQHELATPLAVLNMTVSMRDGDGAIPREVHGTVKRSVHRVARLVESLDLLDRLDRGTLTLRPVEVDLGLMLRRIAGEIGAHSSRTVDVHAPDRLQVDVDGALIEQVVTNLLTNAIKYSPDTEAVTISVNEGDHMVRVEVHDSGPGIAPERVGTIWRKFGRLDHAVPGSGIGLYLARGIARAHGGELRYRAGEPVGSVFVLELPLGDDVAPS